MIVWVNVVQNRTVLDSDSLHDVSTTCAVVLFRVKVSCITSVDGIGDGKRILRIKGIKCFFVFSYSRCIKLKEC